MGEQQNEAYQEVLKRILEAAETHATELDLSGFSAIRWLPPESGKLTSLLSLNLTSCSQIADLRGLEQLTSHLGSSDLCLYKAMQDWHNRVGDILAYVADVLHPHGFDAIVENDFAALKEMLLNQNS